MSPSAHIVGTLFLPAIVILTACTTQAAAPPGAAAVAAPVVSAAPAAPRPASPGQSDAHSQNVTIVLPQIPAASNGPAVSPEMIEALKALSAEDYKTRQDALARMQQAMGQNIRQIVLVQEMMLEIQSNLAEQLRTITLSPDVEASARTASLLEFNNAVSRWAIDALALPEDRRKTMLDWGLKPENLTLIGKAYARRADVRAAAAREIAKVDGDQATWLLVQLINDPDREVSLNAMDAAWDRAPSVPVIDALWNRASAYLMMQMRQQNQRVRMVNIRGRVIPIYDQQDVNNRMADGDVAADVLLHYKSPAVADKLNAVFVELGNSAGNPNDYRWRVISATYGGEGALAFTRLVEAYKPREAVPAIIKMLAMNSNDGSDTNIPNNNNNNEKARYSTRIDAAVMLIKIIGQDPEDYGVRKYSNWGNRWLLKGGVDEENELVKRIQAWWKVNAKDYGVDLPQVKADPNDPKALKPPPLAHDPALKVKPAPAASQPDLQELNEDEDK